MVYSPGIGLGTAFIGMGVFIFFIVICFNLMRLCLGSKSHQYRKYLTNLFVSAKIRELSKKHNVDLNAEELELIKYLALNNKDRMRDLDDKIEAELLEEINNPKETKKKE